LLPQIPELVGFWLLTFLVQFPLALFSLFSIGLQVVSIERTINSIHFVFVTLELIFGYGAVKRIAGKQVLRFRAMQRSVMLAAKNRQLEETTC
jgi:transmembrane protein 17